MVIALFGVSAIMSINYNIDMVIHMVNAFFWGGGYFMRSWMDLQYPTI